MTTLSALSDYNVAATLNDDFQAFVVGITLPSWFGAPPTFQLISDKFEPDVPTFSVNHIDVSSDYAYQGNQGSAGATTRDTALMEINGWVTRSDDDNPNWLAQLRLLADMAKQWANQHSVIVINNYLSDATNPTATNGLVRLKNRSTVPTAHDPNPDIERVRILIEYWWDYRG